MQIVVFTGGQSPEPKDTELFFKNRKADYIIAADSGLDTLERYNECFNDVFSPNIILGDMDSIQDKSKINNYPNASVEKFPCDKDYTDTELALIKAKEVSDSVKEESSIILVGGAGGRIDHLLGIYDTFSEKFHADVWLYEKQALYFVEKGGCLEIKSLLLKDNVSIARLSGSRRGGRLSSRGLKWEYCHFRKKGMPSISNRISEETFNGEGKVVLKAKRGRFLIITPIGAEVSFKDL